MNGFGHIEIPTTNFKKAKNFYGTVFGWSFEDAPDMDYVLFRAARGPMADCMNSRRCRRRDRSMSTSRWKTSARSSRRSRRQKGRCSLKKPTWGRWAHGRSLRRRTAASSACGKPPRGSLRRNSEPASTHERCSPRCRTLRPVPACARGEKCAWERVHHVRALRGGSPLSQIPPTSRPRLRGLRSSPGRQAAGNLSTPPAYT